MNSESQNSHSTNANFDQLHQMRLFCTIYSHFSAGILFISDLMFFASYCCCHIIIVIFIIIFLLTLLPTDTVNRHGC